MYTKVSREAFFQSQLQRNSNELLGKARGLVSRMEAELVNTPVSGPSRVKGLPDSIDPNKPPRNYRNAMRICGNQQVEGVHYKTGDLYAPVKKASEVRLMVAIAAQYECTSLKTDTKQAFLNEKLELKRYLFALRTGGHNQFLKDMPCC